MKRWTDKEIVCAIVERDNAALEQIYHSFRTYFMLHAGTLFAGGAPADDIFHDALVHLWREIETRRIAQHDGRICRWTDGEPRPMTSSLTTFLIAIAKRKHWEQLRREHLVLTDNEHTLETLDRERYEQRPPELTDDEVRQQVVADAVLRLTERCRDILTLFYYEHHSLDEILAIRPANNSKMGLKTSKYKCMQRLRQSVHDRLSKMGLD